MPLQVSSQVFLEMPLQRFGQMLRQMAFKLVFKWVFKLGYAFA